MITPETALALARMAQDFCAILLWGGYAYLAFLVPSAVSSEISKSLRPTGKQLVLLLFCATLATLALQSANLGDGWGDAFNGEILHGILFESSIGTSWIAQSLAAMVLLIAAFATPQQQGLLACLAGLFLSTRLLIGHAVMLEGPNEMILRLSYLTHVLAAGAWVGALGPVFLIMRTMTQHATSDQTIALRRFSMAGHFAVALTVISGFVNSALIRGRLLPNPGSAYDAMLTLKIVIAAAMILIAITNRYGVVPRLRGSGRAVQALRVLTASEFALALLVIIVVNVLSTTNPH